MSMVIVYLSWILLFTTPSSVKSTVWIDVAGCVRPNTTHICWMYNASLVVIKSALNSASVAEDMTCLMICAMFRMALLLGGWEA